MRASGIDISHHQGELDLHAGQLDFAILRAGYGRMPDRRFDQYVHAAKGVPARGARNIPRGAYHYFSSAVPWREQAQFFLARVDGLGFDFYALDFEPAFNHKSAGFADGARKWLEEVKAAAGKPVLLYTNPSTYETWLRPFGDWMDNWPLWVAQYPSRSWTAWVAGIKSTLTRQPWLPKGRADWTIWQYSADGNRQGPAHGVSSPDVDLNVWNGAVEDMLAWLAIAPKDEEIPHEQPDYAPVFRQLSRVLDEAQALIPEEYKEG